MEPAAHLPLPFSKQFVWLGAWGLFTSVYAIGGRLFRIVSLGEGALFGGIAFLIGRVTYPLFFSAGKEFSLLFGIQGRKRTKTVFHLIHRVFYVSSAALFCTIIGVPLTAKGAVGLVLVGQLLWFIIRKVYETGLRVIAFWYVENFQPATHA